MLEQLETLVAIADVGTMTRAATRLRISQSAISKRVANLEATLSAKLVEREGRRVRLTPAGTELVAKTRLLLGEVRDVVEGHRDVARGRVVLGVAESVLSSWGPGVLARVKRALPEVTLELHAHRSPVCVDNVMAGEYTLAVIAGSVDATRALWSDTLTHEEMVLVGRVSGREVGRGEIYVTTIPTQSFSFKSLGSQLAALRARGIHVRVERELESFASVVQLGRHGFGAALVPLPLAQALGVPAAKIARFPAPGLARPISLVGRKTALLRPAVSAFRDALLKAMGAQS